MAAMYPLRVIAHRAQVQITHSDSWHDRTQLAVRLYVSEPPSCPGQPAEAMAPRADPRIKLSARPTALPWRVYVGLDSLALPLAAGSVRHWLIVAPVRRIQPSASLGVEGAVGVESEVSLN